MEDAIFERPAEILLVEDNEDDVVLMREGFKRSKLLVKLHHVGNGVECMSFLQKQDGYEDAPTPDLILLDLNMPLMDGREVLEKISSDEELCHLPVIILTTSSEEQDVLSMYKLRCSSYIVKPVDFEKFQQVVSSIGNYWFTVVVLPKNGENKSN